MVLRRRMNGEVQVRWGVLIVLVVALVVACGASPLAAPGPAPTRTPAQATAQPLVIQTGRTAGSPVQPAALPQARVVRVADGDTVDVSPGGRIRLIGIDTPEIVDPRKPVQCFGREASTKAHKLLDEKTIAL